MKLKKNIAVSESGLLFNPVTGESFSVNPIGIEVLGMIREGKEQEEICAVLTERYTADMITIERDYHDFIDLLAHHHLLDRHEDE